ncbi:regulatory protein SipA [Allocoleopsis franciscana]|uniref:DUF3148 domain-containing protein n=1 Tax=Allocoleopsis franciscana PCC 7113 TaxID=1173027 RepID=K9W8B1_9CYAN|nr:DUF3148 domain-containing protein [Allocoleopsis franciscana]AFZ16009.1 Protein of unknown function (DUF3148) [Allocoleopsis franciscana PCC 7113]
MSKEFAVGDRVRVIALPRYVKTAEPMPMLRPPNVIHIGEEGIILDRRPGGYWGVRFTKGAFLMDSQYIESVDTASTTPQSHEPLPESSET